MQAIKVVEPRVNVREDEQKNHIVLQGGSRYTEKTHIADSWGNPGETPVEAQFSFDPPSAQTITDRMMRIRCYVDVESKDGDFQLGTNDGPRQFPIHSMCETLTVQINGESISDNIGEKLHAMLAYGNCPEDRNKTWSTTPAMPDQYQQLSDWTTYGSGKNPLADYGENSSETPRGGFVAQVISPTHIRYVITEPVLMSPFYDGLGSQVEGFCNVEQFDLSYRWVSDPSQFWTHSDAGNAISGVNVSFYRAPEILVTYITPDITQNIPRLLTLPYHKQISYRKDVSAMAIGEKRTGLLSDSIKLSQIPRRMYIFVKQNKRSMDFTQPNAFAGISRISVDWENQTGLFGSATQQDLYEISRRNGLNMSYTQFAKHRGSVICIEFGTQLGLLDNEAPGVRGAYMMSVSIDVENLSGEADWDGQFYLVAVNEGTFQIAENIGRATLGNLSADVAFAAKRSEELDYTHYEALRGGGFFSSLKSFVNKVARGVQTGAAAAEKLAPAVVGAFPELAPVAAAIPAVSAGAALARSLSGGGLAGGRLSGGSVMRRRRR